MSPSARASTASPRLSTGKFAAPPRQHRGTWAGAGALRPKRRLPPHPSPHTSDSAACGGVCWRAEPRIASLEQMLTLLPQIRQDRDACCTLPARARHPLAPRRKTSKTGKKKKNSKPTALSLSLTTEAEAAFQPEEGHKLCRQESRQETLMARTPRPPLNTVYPSCTAQYDQRRNKQVCL